ncbi:Nif3-like dinuclear metal center hexameric protein [Luteolibacter algae]|uniref:Nif3-like dinuclear metal center hexameric protein n=1 Tax=Luteolibacter algae TaxID=454151 RepID=A0ABW5D3H5_9BACT
MAILSEIVGFLDAELRTSEIQDYPGALNGLQLQNSGRITKVISAVDASLAVIEEAAKTPGALLLVHHGLFWQGAQPITGPRFGKIKAAINADLAIYSTHLPLDMHPTFGNNILLAKAIGLREVRTVLHKKGWPTGVCGVWDRSSAELKAAVAGAVGREIVICESSREIIREVVVITGGAASEVAAVADLGVDAFVTGEGSHWTYVEAEDRDLTLLYAGHYATETFGVRELGAILADRFGLPGEFIDRIGGL